MNFCQCVDSHDLIWGAKQNHLRLKFGFCRNTGGRWLTQSQLLKPKPQSYKTVILLGPCRNMGGGPQVQPKITSKITNHQEDGTFLRKNNMLKIVYNAK